MGSATSELTRTSLSGNLLGHKPISGPKAGPIEDISVLVCNEPLKLRVGDGDARLAQFWQRWDLTASLRTVLVVNQYNNSAPLIIGQIAIEGSDDFAIVPSKTTCTVGRALQPSGQCQIAVTFTPDMAGAQNGSITITNNASNSPQSVALVGTGR